MGTNTYLYNGNQLNSISGFTNGSYQYDVNGNMKLDGPKNVTIEYNYLNLPVNISKPGELMQNTFLANGAKLKKTVGGLTREYVGGIEYNNGVIEFIQTEEGRARPNGNNYFYEYVLKDHLGNTRVMLDQSGTVLETSDYYPFGLQVARAGNTTTSPENRYKYNGKELQTELGLMEYDYGARFYDPVTARWNTMDPLAEQYRKWSPYNYVMNNPMRFIDPDGMEVYNSVGEFQSLLDWAKAASSSGDENSQEDPDKKKKSDEKGIEHNGRNPLTIDLDPFKQPLTPFSQSFSKLASGPSLSKSSGKTQTPWMDIAISQLGVKEATHDNDGPAVDKYLATAGLAESRLPWCGCFANWSMKGSMIKGPKGPALALNWRNFGQNLSRPAYGSLGTLEREGGGGHVGFVVAKDAGRANWIIMLGGNQSDGVTYRSFPISIMKFNYPLGFVPSYSLPSMSGIPRGIKMH